ncbi:MAG: MFS transporter [Caldilineaceae bacterium]|nr:MFS transporter [Caldilineaceae bacterium]
MSKSFMPDANLAFPAWSVNNERNYQITWLATFLFFVAFYALIVPLPRYLTALGLADWQVGFVLGATSIASLLTRPISGVLTDRFGFKPMLLFGAGSLVLGAVGVLFTQMVALLFALRVLQALGYVIFTTAGNALVGELASPSDRSTKIAYFGLAANFAMTMTPGATDLLLPAIGLQRIFWVVGLIAVSAGLLTRLLRIAPTSAHHHATHQQVAGTTNATIGMRPLALAQFWHFPRHIWLSMGVAALFGAGFGAYFQFFAVLLERRAIAAAPVYATYGISIIITRLLFGRYLDRIGFTRVLLIAALTMTVGLCVAAVGTSLPMLVIAAALIAAGGGFFHPMLIAHHVAMLPGRPGWAVACFYFGFDAGIGIGAWLLGAVLDLWDLHALFFAAALLTLATLPLLPRLARQTEK